MKLQNSRLLQRQWRLSEEMIKSEVVSQKYDDYISELIQKAEIVKNQWTFSGYILFFLNDQLLNTSEAYDAADVLFCNKKLPRWW